MGIRHWHPAKVAMLWVLDIALLIALWKPCDTDHLLGFSMTECFYTRNILLWLVLSSPVFFITWKWASGREARFVPDSVPNPNEHVPLPASSTGVQMPSLPMPFLHKASPEIARALVLQSLKDHKVLKIKGTDGAEMDVAVRYEMHPYHWEHFGPCFMAIRHPEKRGAKRVWEQIKYSDIAELAITGQKYALRFRLEDHYKRIIENKLYRQIGMLVTHILLIGTCGGFAAMILAIFVSDRLLLTSYKTAFWWIAGIIATFFLIWIFWRRSALLEPDGPMEGTPRVYGGVIFGVLFGSVPLYIFANLLLDHTIELIGWTSIVLLGLTAYFSAPKGIQDRFLAAIINALPTGFKRIVALLLIGLLVWLYGHYLGYLGERYNPTLQAMMNLPVQENPSEHKNQ